MNNPPPLLTNRSGFSLVELMIVMVVAGIMLALAAPRMNGYVNRVRVDGAADDLASQVSYAQTLAVRQSRFVDLEIRQIGTAPGARYQYTIDEIDGGASVRRRTGYVNGTGDHLDLAIYTDAVVTAYPLSPGPYTIRFSPRGLLVGTLVPDSVVVTRDDHRATLRFTALGKAYRVY